MKVELTIHASNLKNVAGLGKGTSDPYAVVTQIATSPGQKPQVIGRTEVIKNSLSPNWVKTFVLDYELGTPMKVAIQIYDEIRKGTNKSMGSATFDIGEVLGARGNTKAKNLKKGGTIFAHVSKSKGSGLLRLKLKGIKLKNTEGFMKKSDPFFEVCRRLDSAGGLTWDNVFRSNVVKDNLSPTWNDATIELSTLCKGDLSKPIQVVVYDHESDGKHVLMGMFDTSVDELLTASTGGTDNMEKAISLQRKGKETGKIIVLKAEVSGIDDVTKKMAGTSIASAPIAPAPTAPVYTPAVAPTTGAFVPSAGQPTFVDYISGGCNLNVCIAIDFTGSNGDPRDPNTLHHISRNGSKNDYEKAITAIVNILSKYDSDQQFPVLGFGAKYGGVVRHCFQCGPTAEVRGTQGVLDAYHAVFKSGLIMSGPTVFTEVIQTAAARAIGAQETAKQKGEQAYTILLILTDGSVSDVQATMAALDQASHAPLSVVIVGVGNADFSAMRFLDDASKPGKRDIAQFVEFNKHSRNSVELTSETLREIPDQLVGYFVSNGIQPLPAIYRDDAEIVVEPEEEEIDLSLAFGEDGEIAVVAGGNAYYDDFRDGFASSH